MNEGFRVVGGVLSEWEGFELAEEYGRSFK